MTGVALQQSLLLRVAVVVSEVTEGLLRTSVCEWHNQSLEADGLGSSQAALLLRATAIYVGAYLPAL